MKKVVVKRKGKEVISVSATVEPIDYDKLAEAIVRANNNANNGHSLSNEWMKYIICLIFWGVSVIAGLFAIGFCVTGVKEMLFLLNEAHNMDWQQFVMEFVKLAIGFFLAAVTIFTVLTAKEIDKEKDRQYVAAMFSNIVALVALVVSLIALVQGVG